MGQPPTLHIITGPPGSGKTTFSAKISNGGAYIIYDHDLGNKKDWMGLTPTESVFNAAAPSASNKMYWEALARENGYEPKIYTMWIDRNTALSRMQARSGLAKTQRNDLQSGIQLWYRSYSRHPRETRVTNERS